MDSVLPLWGRTMESARVRRTTALAKPAPREVIPENRPWLSRHYASDELILPHRVSARLDGIVYRGQVRITLVRDGKRHIVGNVLEGGRLNTEAWAPQGASIEFRAVEPTILWLLPQRSGHAVDPSGSKSPAATRAAVEPQVMAQARSQASTAPEKQRPTLLRRHVAAGIILVTVLLLGVSAWRWQAPWRSVLARLTYGLGSNALRAQRYDRAADLLQTSLSLDGELARAHSDLGYIRYRQGRLSDARAAFQQALEADPDLGVAYNNLGLYHLETGKLEQASAALRRAVALDPESATAWTNLGTAEALAGHREEALSAYRGALRIDPADLFARANLGSLLYQQGHQAEARDHLQAALAAHPGLAQARLIVGAVAFSEGDRTGAWDQFQIAAATLPDDPLLHFFLALGYEEAGQWEDAKRELSKVLDLTPHPDLAQLARSHLIAAAGRKGYPSIFEASTFEATPGVGVQGDEPMP